MSAVYARYVRIHMHFVFAIFLYKIKIQVFFVLTDMLHIIVDVCTQSLPVVAFTLH